MGGSFEADDKDEIVIEGYNREIIAYNIKKLLTKQGVKLLGKIHKWRFIDGYKI